MYPVVKFNDRTNKPILPKMHFSIGYFCQSIGQNDQNFKSQ